MQQHSQNLAGYAPPSFYCNDFSVLLIVFIPYYNGYCKSSDPPCCRYGQSYDSLCHMAVESGGSLIFLANMSCGSWQNCHDTHTHHSILYLITVLTIWKTSRSFPLSSKLTAFSKNLDKLLLLQSTHPTLHTSPHTLPSSCLHSFVLLLHPNHFCPSLKFSQFELASILIICFSIILPIKLFTHHFMFATISLYFETPHCHSRRLFLLSPELYPQSLKGLTLWLSLFACSLQSQLCP